MFFGMALYSNVVRLSIHWREDTGLHTIVAVCPESIDHIMRKTEWDYFRFLKGQALYNQISKSS